MDKIIIIAKQNITLFITLRFVNIVAFNIIYLN